MATVTAGSSAAVPADGALTARLGRLRRWNIVVGIVLGVQAALIAALTNGFSLPVTATFMSGPPGTPARLHHLFDLPLGWGVVAFLAISAGALLVIASPPVFGWYTANLRHNRNYGRWIEYFFSSSLMIVLIAMITGISDIAALARRLSPAERATVGRFFDELAGIVARHAGVRGGGPRGSSERTT